MRRESEKGRANPMAMSAEERQQMLLTQPVEKIIPKMALPTICSMLITSIYNMADTYFVSQIGTAEATASGTSASAAVGIVFSAMAMIQALAFMFGMGSGTNVSHLLGMGKRKEAEVYSAVGFFSAVAAGVLIAVLGNVFNEPLMRLLGATETAMPYALDYARYIFLAAPFMMGSLSMNNLLRFQGLATYGMVGIISGGVLNMLLDPLLIFVFDMGIAGASIATAISQLTSFAILLVMCSTHADAITIHPRNYRPTKQMYAKILNNGLPSLGRQGIMSVSTSLLNNAAAVYGDPAIAAFAIVSRCLNFVNSTVVGFGQGFQPVCGFNYGARKYDRMHRAFSFSVKVTTIVLLVLGAVLIALGANLLVDNGTLIAQALGVPESVIALTFVALGTSLPELVTAITSLIKGHSDLSVGNVVGANVFNLVLVSGVSVTLAPFTIPQSSTLFGVNSSLVLDLPVMLAVMLIMTVPALVKGKMNRAQGIILLAIYAAFCAIQFTM